MSAPAAPTSAPRSGEFTKGAKELTDFTNASFAETKAKLEKEQGCSFNEVDVDAFRAAVQPEFDRMVKEDGVTPTDRKITVFTTRADTLFGVSFFLLPPESPLAAELVAGTEYEAAFKELKAASPPSTGTTPWSPRATSSSPASLPA